MKVNSTGLITPQYKDFVLLVACALILAFALAAYAVQAQGQDVTTDEAATWDSPPGQPGRPQATVVTHDYVTITWAESSDESVTHYAILRRNRDTDAAGVFHVIQANAGLELSYTDSTVAAESSYVYRVKAVSPTGVSRWSGYVNADTPAAPEPTPEPTATPQPTPEPTATPDPTPAPEPEAVDVTADAAATGDNPPDLPTNLETTAEHDEVTLTWVESTDGSVTHYAILRRNPDTDAPGAFQVIDADAGPGVSYTDSTVAAESSYVYRVKAVSPTGVSRWSGYADADTPAAPQSTPEPTPAPTPDPASLAPSGLSAFATHDSGVFLTWDAPEEDAGTVTGYEVLRAQGEADLTTLVGNTGSAGASYTDATATEPGETYAYTVRALRGGEKSQASNRTAAVIPTQTLTFIHVDGEPPTAEPAQSGFPADLGLKGPNRDPWGLWSNETTMWVADFRDNKLYAYDLDTDNRDTSLDITLDTENTHARGIWSDDETMFVADEMDNHIYAYVLTPGTTFGDRDSDKDIALSTDSGANDGTKGIWSNRTTMWVVNNRPSAGDDKLLAYRMIEDTGTTETEYGTRDSDKDIPVRADDRDFDEENTDPQGIWSDGTTMWVAEGYSALTGERRDSITDRLYAYRLTDDPDTVADEFGAYDRDKNITLAASTDADNGAPRGIWSNGITVWVADVEDYKLYTYFLPQTAVDVPATGQPTISGTAQVRKTLTADIAEIADTANGIDYSTFTYRWLSSDDGTNYTAIPGASGLRYTLVRADLGRTIKVEVSFIDGGGFDEGPLTSDATGEITLNYGRVIYSAALTVGADADDLGYSNNFGGIDPNIFSHDRTDFTVIRIRDRGSHVDFDLSLPLPTGSYILFLDQEPLPLESSGTTAIYSIPNRGLNWSVGDVVQVRLSKNRPATGLVTISGTPVQVGRTLTAGTLGFVDDDGIPGNVTYTYQWTSSGDGAIYTPITGATGRTYILEEDDAGKAVKVEVGFTDSVGFEEAVTSASTTPVLAADRRTIELSWAYQPPKATAPTLFSDLPSYPIKMGYEVRRSQPVEQGAFTLGDAGELLAEV